MSELSVKQVHHMGLHRLGIEFSDGHEQNVDFAPFIFSSGHPDYDKYKQESEFLKYEIVDGNLNWDDYTMIFPVEALYSGKLTK